MNDRTDRPETPLQSLRALAMVAALFAAACAGALAGKVEAAVTGVSASA